MMQARPMLHSHFSCSPFSPHGNVHPHNRNSRLKPTQVNLRKSARAGIKCATPQNTVPPPRVVAEFSVPPP
eukprot:1844748-Prorocentrum_lima.AAC.1